MDVKFLGENHAAPSYNNVHEPWRIRGELISCLLWSIFDCFRTLELRVKIKGADPVRFKLTVSYYGRLMDVGACGVGFDL